MVAYAGVEKRPEHEGRQVIWKIAARRSTYQKLRKRSVLYKARRKIEKARGAGKGEGRAPVPGDQAPVRLCEDTLSWLAKNTAQRVTLFALSNLWMARRHLLSHAVEVRL
ncbi:hypothetical protein EMIT0P4_10171 [Pseudomonas sp. IT-P4]